MVALIAFLSLKSANAGAIATIAAAKSATRIFLLLVVLAPLGGFLLGLLRRRLFLGGALGRLPADDLRRRLAGLGELQDRVLEELHEAEYCRGLRRVQRLGTHEHLLVVIRVVELGEIFAACLIENELDAKLGHWCSSSSRDNSEHHARSRDQPARRARSAEGRRFAEARAEAERNPGEGRRRRREPARRAPAHGPVSGSSRGVAASRARNRRRGGRGGRRRETVEARRQGLRARKRRRLRRVLRGAGDPGAAASQERFYGGGGVAAGDLLHRLGQRLRPRPS